MVVGGGQHVDGVELGELPERRRVGSVLNDADAENAVERFRSEGRVKDVRLGEVEVRSVAVVPSVGLDRGAVVDAPDVRPGGDEMLCEPSHATTGFEDALAAHVPRPFGLLEKAPLAQASPDARRVELEPIIAIPLKAEARGVVLARAEAGDAV